MVADQPTNPAAILARTREAWTALDAALAQISTEEMLRPRTSEGWSLRDILCHLGNPWLTAQLDAHLDGREPTMLACFGHEVPPEPSEDMSTNDGRNDWHRRALRSLSMKQVHARYLDFRGRTEAILERLPEGEGEVIYALLPFGHVGRVGPAGPAGPGGPLAFPLWQWLREETWHHFEDHLRDFEAAIQTTR